MKTPFASFSAPRLSVWVGVAALLTSIGLFASRPAHTAGGPVPVAVTNTITNHDADNSARQPFQASTQYLIAKGEYFGTLDTNSGYPDITVPDGKRLVIQTVSMYLSGQLLSGNTYQAFVEPTTGGTTQLYFLPTTTRNGGFYVGEIQNTTLYADPGTTVSFLPVRNTTNGEDSVYFTVSGYLVNVP